MYTTNPFCNPKEQSHNTVCYFCVSFKKIHIKTNLYKFENYKCSKKRVYFLCSVGDLTCDSLDASGILTDFASSVEPAVADFTSSLITSYGTINLDAFLCHAENSESHHPVLIWCQKVKSRLVGKMKKPWMHLISGEKCQEWYSTRRGCLLVSKCSIWTLIRPILMYGIEEG